MALPAGLIAWVCPSRLHFPVPLGSTVVTRFVATTGTLTPALLVLAPEQVSLVHALELLDIPSPTTPCASVRQCSLLRADLAADSPQSAIGGSSDFAHPMQARQSHQAESSLCRSLPRPHFYGLSVHFQLLSTGHRWPAVTFSYWREAPPERDFHPPIQVRSQAHTCRSYGAWECGQRC